MISGAATEPNIKAMVFAAGLGTRLRPLTEERPKPGVPVANRALASYSIAHLAKNGATHIVLNTHYLAVELPGLLRPDTPYGVELDFIYEPDLLGTGGGLRNAWPYMKGDDDALVVIMNGDVIYEPDLAGAIALHRKLGAVATMVLRPDPDARTFGAIEIDAQHRVRRLLGKPVDVAEPLDVFMFTGVHVLSPRAFTALPEEGCIIRNSYRHWIDSGEVVAGFVDSSPWRDLGTLRQYLDGNLDGLTGNLIHPTANVDESATLDHCVIGAHAKVGPHARLRRSVVWPHASTDDAYDEVVITSSNVVRIHG